MKITKLIINFVSKGVGWGLTLGIGLSILYTLLLVLIGFGFPVMVYGIFYGMLSGVLLGGVNGLILAMVTIGFPSAKSRPIEYARVTLLSSLIVTGIGAFIVFNMLLVGAMILILPATLIAMIGAGYASHEVSTWYLKQEGKLL